MSHNVTGLLLKQMFQNVYNIAIFCLIEDASIKVFNWAFFRKLPNDPVREVGIC
jgi:hypothetical protein